MQKTHKIQQFKFQVNYPGQQGATQAQNQVFAKAKGELYAICQQLFDQYFPAGHYALDCIELDLGRLTTHQFNEQFAQLFQEKLQDYLLHIKTDPLDDAAGTLTSLSTDDKLLAYLQAWFQEGQIPWNLQDIEQQGSILDILQLWSKNPREVRGRFLQVLQQKTARERFLALYQQEASSAVFAELLDPQQRSNISQLQQLLFSLFQAYTQHNREQSAESMGSLARAIQALKTDVILYRFALERRELCATNQPLTTIIPGFVQWLFTHPNASVQELKQVLLLLPLMQGRQDSHKAYEKPLSHSPEQASFLKHLKEQHVARNSQSYAQQLSTENDQLVRVSTGYFQLYLAQNFPLEASVLSQYLEKVTTFVLNLFSEEQAEQVTQLIRGMALEGLQIRKRNFQAEAWKTQFVHELCLSLNLVAKVEKPGEWLKQSLMRLQKQLLGLDAGLSWPTTAQAFADSIQTAREVEESKGEDKLPKEARSATAPATQAKEDAEGQDLPAKEQSSDLPPEQRDIPQGERQKEVQAGAETENEPAGGQEYSIHRESALYFHSPQQKYHSKQLFHALEIGLHHNLWYLQYHQHQLYTRLSEAILWLNQHYPEQFQAFWHYHKAQISALVWFDLKQHLKEVSLACVEEITGPFPEARHRGEALLWDLQKEREISTDLLLHLDEGKLAQEILGYLKEERTVLKSLTQQQLSYLHNLFTKEQQIQWQQLLSPQQKAAFPLHEKSFKQLLHAYLQGQTTTKEAQLLLQVLKGQIIKRKSELAWIFVSLKESEQHKLLQGLPEEYAHKLQAVARGLDQSFTDADAAQTPAAQSSPAYVTEQQDQYYIRNAGLILLSPYIKMLFQRMHLLDGGAFVSPKEQVKAIQALHYLCSGQTHPEEPMCILNKLLCAWPLTQPILEWQDLSTQEQVLCDGLLDAVLKNWTALKNISRDSLRAGFLLREGQLSFDTNQWRLQVEQKTLDVLVDKLPWSFTTTRFPWMEFTLFTEWR